MNDNIEERPEVRTALATVGELEAFASTFQVATAEQYAGGADDLKRVKAAQKTLEDTRTSLTGPLNETLKRINALFRAPADRLARVESVIKGKLLAFQQEQERRRLEAQRKADEEARRERERLQAIADRAAAKGQEVKAEQFSVRAATTVAPTFATATPKIAGLATRDNWTYTIVDASKLPRQFLIPDEKKIGQLVRSMKGDAQAILGEGVKVENKPILAAGAA